jgi:hypothetical protein
MIQVTFIRDYYDMGKLQIHKGMVYELYEHGGTISLPDNEGFLDLYDIYGLKQREFVTIEPIK